MKPISRHLMALVLASGLLSSTAHAQEHFAPDLGLRKTYIKTVSSLLFPETGEGIPAFTPTTITCPNGGTCTVRVELSALVETRSEHVHAGLLVDQQPFNPAPLSVENGIFEFPRPEGSSTAPTTFAWIAQGLTPGDHTIEMLIWRAFTTNNEPRLKTRTLTIAVYR